MPLALLAFAATPSCSAESPDVPEPGSLEGSAALVSTASDLHPTSDVQKDHVVGVGDTSNLFLDVDDTVSDDSTTYVRGMAGIATTSHTVGYSGAAPGLVTSVRVSYRAMRGSTHGTTQVFLYDGSTLIGTGKVNTQGAWADFSDTFTGLNVASANNLRTKMVMKNTDGVGAIRYTQIFLTPNVTTTDGGAPAPDAGSSDSGSTTDAGGGSSDSGSTTDAGGGGGTTGLCGSSATPPARYAHVVVIMEENRTWSSVGGVGFGDPAMPYLHSLAQQCTTFSSWTETNTTQNSLNQYIGLTSGVSNTSTVNDCSPSATCQSTDDNIFRQVRLAGGTARSYVEGATTGCSASGNAAKHVPALYYYGTYVDGAGVTHNDHDYCNTEVRPLTEFDVNNLPTFAMITPNLCNDGHDCGNGTVDTWAKGILPKILGSASYAAGNTLVVVVYDEDHPVPNLLMAPTATVGVNDTSGAGHAALLKTWEEILGLPVMQQGQLPSAISLRGPAHL